MSFSIKRFRSLFFAAVLLLLGAGLMPGIGRWGIPTVYGAPTSVTYYFEDIIHNGTSFASSSQTFTLTGNMVGQKINDFGSNLEGETGHSDGYMDSVYLQSRTGNVGGIAASAGYTFRAQRFDVWPSQNGGDNVLNPPQSITVIGKRNGSQVVSATVASAGYGQNPVALGGAWQRIDLTGTDFATTDIDTVEFVLNSPHNYLAVDNFVYSTLGLASPTATATATATNTSLPTATNTATATATNTPVPTATSTATPAATPNTPIDGITTFNSFPSTYTEYARTTNGASGFTATNLAGWDMSGYTTAGSNTFVIASENWGAGSDGALVYVALETGSQTITSVRFASNDGKLFDLNGIDFGYDSWQGAPATTFTFTGYVDGVPVSGATYTTAAVASFGNSGTWQRGITFTANIKFQGIDEFRITTANAVLTALDIDNINATNFRNPESAPTLTATGATPTFTQGSSTGVDLFSSVTAATNDSGQSFTSAVLTVSNVADTTEYLTIDGTDVALTNGASGTITGIGNYAVSVAGNTATVTLSGMTHSDANMGTLIDGMSYKNSDATLTTGSRVVTLVSVTDSGSSNNSATVNQQATVTLQAPAPALYYLSSDGSSTMLGATDALNRIKPDGTGGAVLKRSIHPAPGDLALDLANQRAFFLGATSTNSPGVYSVNLTSGTVFTVTTLPTGPFYGGITYDPVGGYIYYLSSDGSSTTLGATDALSRIKPDGTGGAVLKSSIHPAPGDLALDLANQRAFFLGATSTNSPGVYGVNLTSGAVFTVITLPTGPFYGGITYDPVGGYIYYLSSDGSSTTLGATDALNRIKPDGTGAAVLKSSIHPAPGDLALDLVNQRAFFLGATSTNSPGVYSVNLASGTVFTVTTLPTGPFYGGIVYTDETVPTFDGANSLPADDATAVTPTSSLALRFSESVIKGITGTFIIRDVTANTVLETLAYTDTQIAGWATNTLTITPSANLPANHEIAVQWRFGSIRDYYDNYVIANATDTTYNVTIGTASNADLTVNKTGNGTGTVTSLPAAIACGVTCTATFSSSLVVTLTATADVGSVFAGWSGACSGTGNCIVTMSAARAVTATFQIIESTQPYTGISGKAGTLHALGGYLSTITVAKAPTTLPRGIKLPLGQLSFIITGLPTGGTVQLSLYADSSLKVSSYYKRNRLTNAWVDIATAVAVADSTTTRVNFALTDGGPYDADGAANGTIVDPGGPSENLLTPLVRENTTFVTTLEPFTDTILIGTPNYAITGGSDQALFALDADSGLLTFIAAPDYDNPGTANVDSTGRPVYTVTVTINGATSGSQTHTLAVSLLDDPATTGVIQNLAGDYTTFSLNTPAYIDADPNSDTTGFALVGDSTASFANGTLTITQMSGPADGSFTFDGTTATAGGNDVISAGEDVSTNDSLALSITTVGTIDGSADGQNGNSLVIHFNGAATARYVEEILNGLLYTAPTGGVREFYVYVNDGAGATYGTSESVSFVMAGPTEPLTVNPAGTGSGKVTSDPVGIDCGNRCAYDFGSGLTVTLTATADSGSTFSGWSGECSGTGRCIITMAGVGACAADTVCVAGVLAAKVVTATFTADPITTPLILDRYSPIMHTVDVPLDSRVVLTYSAAIAAATVTSRTVAVHSMYQGLVTATHSISGNVVTVTPAQPFFAGELVYTSATTATANLTGTRPLTPTVWQFQTAAAASAGSLADGVNFGPADDATYALAWADADRDGDLDLAVGNNGGQNVLYLNQGDGSFDAGINFGTGSEPTWSLAWGDFDNDGDLDLAVGNSGAQSAVYPNNGDGTFGAAVNFGTEGDSTIGLAWGDFDGDGDLDLATGSDYAGVLYPNNGDGTFGTGINFGTGRTLAWGDFDNDGDLDLAAGSWGQNTLYHNNGDGTFGTGINFGSGSDATLSVAWGDFDGDGDLDLAAGNYSGQNEIYPNLGDGSLGSPRNFGTGSDSTRSLAVGDFDGDGDLDLAVGNENEQNVLYLNQGDGTFDTGLNFGTGNDATLSVAWGDADGDGDLDLAAGNYNEQNVLYRNVPPRLAVNKTGSGNGMVTSLPASIACGITCTADFAYSTVVTLTAVADSGSTFAGWFDACSGISNCTVTMTANSAVTATFTLSNSPTIMVGGLVSFTAGGGPIVVAPQLTLGDPTDGIREVRVAITPLESGDLLAFTATAGLTGTYNAATGILALTGNGTTAQWQSLLRTVTYNSTNPAPQQFTRQLGFTIVDLSDAGKAGTEFLVNVTTTGFQDEPSITALSDGGFVMVWQARAPAETPDDGESGDTRGVFGRRFDANGTVLGSEFQINTFTKNDQDTPVVAGLTGGGFVVVWESGEQKPVTDTIDYDDDITMRLYAADGTALGADLLVNSWRGNDSGSDDQDDPDVAALTDGGFVIVWESDEQDAGTTDGIYAQRFNVAGTKVGSEFRVNTTTADDQREPRIVGLTDGGFVVTWVSDEQAGSIDNDIYAQRYTAAGSPVGGEFLVNQTIIADQVTPFLGAMSDGGFIVTWTTENADDTSDVYFRRYNGAGTAITAETQVNSGTDGTEQSVSALRDGGFVIIFEAPNGVDSNGTGVFGQRYNAQSTKVGDAFQVNSLTAGNQDSPVVGPLAGGGFLVTWEGPPDSIDTDDNVYGQRFLPFAIAVTDALTLTITLVNDAPTFTNLDGDSVAWADVGNTVRVDQDGNATIGDTEFEALNGGNGDWAGATLTIQRASTAWSADLFAFDPTGSSFTIDTDALQVAGQTFATFTNSGGVLTINFTSTITTATTALVQAVLRHLTYRNDTPAADATLRFTLSDGNSNTTADVTVTSDTVYVTNNSDSATIDLSDGVSFSEAVAIALADTTGHQALLLSSAFAAPVTLAGDLALGEGLTVNAAAADGVTLSGSSITIASGFILTWTNASTSATIDSVLAGTGGLIKSGSGTLTLAAHNSATGTITVAAGTLLVTGRLADSSNVVVVNGSTLGGNGTVGAVVVQPNGTLAPGSGLALFTVNDGLTMAANSVLAVALNGSTPGTDYDQIVVTGTVNLTDANLTLDLSNFTPGGSSFTLIDNDGSDPINGTLTGLAQGATFSTAGFTFQLSYTGGDGNDLVLTMIQPLTVGMTGAGSGTVTSLPAGIACGITCTANFAYNTVVTLTAVADSGSTFSGWSGECSGTGDCVVNMAGVGPCSGFSVCIAIASPNKVVTATFALDPITTTLTLTTMPNPVTAQDALTLTATLAPIGTGTVQFYVDGATFGAAQTLVAGAAQLLTTTLPAGTYVITAGYSGDGLYLPSVSSVVTQTVTAPPTPTPTVTPTPTTTNTPLPPTATATATETALPTATATATATNTPEPTMTSTLQPTATETEIPEPTATGTLQPTATATSTPEPTMTGTLQPTATATETSTPEPTMTGTLQPTATATETSTPEPTMTGTLQPTATATETETPEPTMTGTLQPTATATETETPEPTMTGTLQPTATATETSTPEPTMTGTLQPTATATETETPEPTMTGTLQPTATATETETPEPTMTGTLQPTATATETSTPESTATGTLQPTATATETSTPESTATGTLQPTATATETSTPEPTMTGTLQPTATATETSTPEPTMTGTLQPTATATETSTPEPTMTGTLQPTATATETSTPAPTATGTLQPTATATETETPEPTASSTATPTATGTPAAGSITGLLFVDRNGNGDQESGEPGVTAATVTLFNSTGQLARVTTDNNGSYQFIDLTPGLYTVVAAAPVEWVAQGSTTSNVNLGSGDVAVRNFGYQARGTLTGVIFRDLDGDGRQAHAESGVAGVTIQLFQNTQLLTTTLSSADGSYQFAALLPGNYLVVMTPPADFVAVTGVQQPVALAPDSAVNLSFGLQPVSTIAGVVYDDSNGDGVRQNSEAGIPNAAIALFTAGPDGVFRTGDEVPVGSMSSGADGSYSFVNQAVGAYAVQLTTPTGYTSTSPSQVVINLAQFWTAVANFGNQTVNTVAATTFEDRNNNGMQEPNEPPLAGLPVVLAPQLQSAAVTAVYSATTNSNGLALFYKVPAGAYTLQTQVPDATYVGQRTLAQITLAANGSAGEHFGFQQIGTVSGAIFSDRDGNGRQDAGEGGLGGVVVTLSSQAGATTVAATVASTAVTASDGTYHFSGLPAGDFQVSVTPPTGYVATTANPVNFTLGASGVDAARALSMGFATIGDVSGRVFADLNKNGVQELTELGVSGATLLLSGNGVNQTVQSTVDGTFLVTGLPNGSYSANLTLPPNHTATTALGATATVDGIGAVTLRFGVRPNLPNAAPVVAPLANVAFLHGQPVAIQVNASDVDDTVLAYNATNLPPGLTIDPNSGLISGQLAVGTAGNYLITVTVTDLQGASGQTSFTVAIMTPTANDEEAEPAMKQRVYLPLVAR